MTTNYFSNFDDSSFNNQKPREFNKLRDDECDIKQRNFSNDKALKFVTTTFKDLIDAKQTKNFFGIDIKDQLFTPANLMDDESKLKMGVSGGQLTNCRVRHELGELPLPTMPARYQLYHGDVSVEDSMRNFVGTNKKSCNPKDDQFYNRSFYMFEGIEKPDATKSVEENIRCGISSRYHVDKVAQWPQGNSQGNSQVNSQGNSQVISPKVGKNYKTPVDMLNVKPSQHQCNIFEYSSNC
jgi:hypothetical protein